MQDRITKIKDYFRGLEICDGIVIVKIDYPGKWVIPSAQLLDELFKVKVVENKKEVGYFYCCEMINGVTPVFDAVDFTIDFNRNLEEKSELLKEKVNELKTLFAEKPIEVLRTIEFKYYEKKAKSKKSKKTEELMPNEEKDEYTQEVTDNTDYDTATISNSTPIDRDNLIDYAINLVNN